MTALVSVNFKYAWKAREVFWLLPNWDLPDRAEVRQQRMCHLHVILEDDGRLN